MLWGRELPIRTFAYVDGFNLYHAIRNMGAKWLDIAGLFRNVLAPPLALQRVKYYTARVSGASDPGQPRRQQIYLNALATTPEVEMHFGNFLANAKLRPIINLPIENRRLLGPGVDLTFAGAVYTVDALLDDPKSRAEVLVIGHHWRKGDARAKPSVPPNALLAQIQHMEEKGSDVNLACHLVNDAHLNRFEAAALLTNDTDLVEPIRIVTKEIGKQVLLFAPPGRPAHKALVGVASGVVHLHKAHVVAAQFPARIVDANSKVIERPAEWAP